MRSEGDTKISIHIQHIQPQLFQKIPNKMTTITLFRFLFLLLSVGAAAHERVYTGHLQSLVLRAGKDTTHRRVDPVPQIACVGGNACDRFTPSVISCTVIGNEDTSERPLWECQADLPIGMRFGTTDVQCEGYESSADPYILAGSCGVQYTLHKDQEQLSFFKMLCLALFVSGIVMILLGDDNTSQFSKGLAVGGASGFILASAMASSSSSYRSRSSFTTTKRGWGSTLKNR